MARAEMEALFGHKVHLFLHVKVRENWADDPAHYREIGLEAPKRIVRALLFLLMHAEFAEKKWIGAERPTSLLYSAYSASLRAFDFVPLALSKFQSVLTQLAGRRAGGEEFNHVQILQARALGRDAGVNAGCGRCARRHYCRLHRV